LVASEDDVDVEVPVNKNILFAESANIHEYKID
jgi:hypothetical protein